MNGTAQPPGGDVLVPNHRHWRGDHCVDPQLVPGVLLSNKALQMDGASILDLAPTVLEALGAAAPSRMIGHSLLGEGSA